MTPQDAKTPPPPPAVAQAMPAWMGYPATRAAFVAAGLVALTLAAYASVIAHGGFVWDDNILLTENRVIPRADGLRIFWWPPQDDKLLADAVSDYWPLSWTTLWLEWRLWGAHPRGYHITNILLHAISVLLLWRLVRALHLPGAALAAAIFAVHPVCVTSVAWISERKNTLSMVFFLLTLLAYVHYDAGWRRRWYALAVLAFVATMLSKTQPIMAPIVLLGVAWWRRGRIGRRDLLAVAPLLVLAAGFAAVTIWFQRHHALSIVASRPEGFWSRLAAAGMIPWFYLSKAIIPVNLTMVYPRWNVEAGTPLSYVPGVLLLAAIAACWWWRRTAAGRALLAALGYFLIVLFPVLGFFEMSFARISLVSDHFQYHAILGPIVLVAAAVSARVARLADSQRRAAVAVIAVVVAVLAGATYHRGRTFANLRTLWADVLAKNPACPEAYYNRGMQLTDDADARLAAGDPNGAAVLVQEAREHYEEAIRLRPEYSEAHNNLGQIYIQRLGNLPKAGYHFARALEIRPDNLAARINLGVAQYQIGATRDAAGNFRRILEADPYVPTALLNLARILATDPDDGLRNGPQAVALAQRLWQLTGPQNELCPDALDTLAMALAETGQYDQAVHVAGLAANAAAQRGLTGLAESILTRRDSYARGEPVRISTRPPPMPPPQSAPAAP